MERKTVEDALILAANAHRGQKDRGGVPYIMHPVHVSTFALALAVKHDVHQMIDVPGYAWHEIIIMVAILHDIVEDTLVSLGQLVEYGFPTDVVDAVDCLSKRDGEEYDDYILRAAQNPISRIVKMADIKHNLDTSRLGQITNKDSLRLRRYVRTLRRLKNWAT